MPRGYRSIILACLGCLILGAQHPHIEAKGKQSDTQASIAASLQNISTTYHEQAERAERPPERDPCGERQYGSSAQLCAEWKAADASADSAWWAWASGILGIISFAGVLTALGLAFHSNWIARDVGKRQLRAYISIEPKGIWAADEDGHVTVPVWLKNAGQTPAYAVNVDSWFTFHSDPRNFNPAASKWPQPDPADSEVMMGPAEECAIYIRLPLDLTDEKMEGLAQKEIAIMHFGYVSYKDAFGEAHTTNFAHYHWGRELSETEAKRCRLGNQGT